MISGEDEKRGSEGFSDLGCGERDSMVIQGGVQLLRAVRSSSEEQQ